MTAESHTMGDDLARYRRIVDRHVDPILLVGADGRITACNPSTAALFGVDAAAVIGTEVTAWIHVEDRAAVRVALDGPAGDPAPRRIARFRVVRPDGRERWVEGHAANELADPAVAATIATWRDITDRVDAERMQEDERWVLAEAQALAGVGYWTSTTDPAQRIRWSAECARIFGGSVEHPPTLAELRAHIVADDRPVHADVLRRMLAGEHKAEVELRIRRRDGEVRWVRVRAAQDHRHGPPRRVLGVIQDVTARRAADDERRAIDARYQRIVETTSEGVLIIDPELRIGFANHQACEMLGYAHDQLIGLPAAALAASEGEQSARRNLERRRRGQVDTYTSALRRRDGTELWVRVTANPMFGADGSFEGSLTLLSDITALRRAAEQANLLAAIVESSEDAIIGLSLDGTITSWNAAAARLYGYTADEMVGSSLYALLPPDHVDVTRAAIARATAGETVAHFAATRRHKDGRELVVSVSVSPITAADGRILGVAKIARDLTALRNAEESLRRTQAQLEQAQKMEAIGSLAGGVAHDFNNLLLVITSYTEMMLSELEPHDPSRADLEEIAHAADRAAGLTRQLLAFSRRQVLQPRVLDPNEVISALDKMIRRLLREDIDVSLQLAARSRVYADPGQLEQVLINLIVNARDAMPDGGHLTIETADVELDDEYASRHVGVAPGEYVLLAVSDTGHGMTEDVRRQAFDPFFTTKPIGKGTGLGLSTVYGIVKQSGGSIWIYSEPGRGTTFKVYLPRTDRVREISQPIAVVSRARGTETILLVEDDDAVRVALRTILRRAGYDVLEARNGGEALLICEERPGRVALVLTDVVMPRMNGRQLSQRLLRDHPELRFLFMSGYTETAITQQGVLEQGLAFLQKPVTPQALLDKVREVLDRGAARPR